MRRRRWRRVAVTLVLLFVAGFLALNWLAYRQVRAMTHFTREGERTARIEDLAGWRKAGVLLLGINLPRPVARATPAKYGVGFEAHRIESTGGMTLDVWHIPGRIPDRLIILFHGYGTDRSSLLEEARRFSDLGYPVLMPDFRGSGGSDGDHTTIGYDEAEDVAAVCRHARERWPGRRQILYGVSMGAAAVLRAIAVEGVQPDGVILESVFDSLLQTVNNRFRAMGVPAFPAARLMVFWGGVQFGFDGFAHRPMDYARSVRCPVLFLHGELDPRATPADGRRVFENVPGSARYFHEFAGCRHEALASACPGRWDEVVGEFLAGLGNR